MRFPKEEENFELVSAMLRRGVEKSLITSEPLRCSRYMHYYFQSGELIPLILPINCAVNRQKIKDEKSSIRKLKHGGNT